MKLTKSITTVLTLAIMLMMNGLFGQTITLPVPYLSFGNVTVSTYSTVQSISITAQNLRGDVFITAPINFEISKLENSGFTNILSFKKEAFEVEPQIVYVRFVPSSVNSFSINMTFETANANTKLVALNGTGTANWIKKTDFGGTARDGAVGFSLGTKGYVGTGSDATGVKKDMFEYNPSTNLWTQMADFGGVARSGAVVFTIGTKAYLGTGSDTKDFWEYNQANGIWTKKADFPVQNYSGKAGFAIGTKGYICTGGDLSNEEPPSINGSKEVWEYNQLTNIWSRKADFAGSVRGNAVGFALNEKGYIGLGWRGILAKGLRIYDKVYTNDFWKYDPIADSWSRIADFPGVARELATGFAIGTKGYVGLGSINGDGSQGSQESFADFWEYDPTVNKWNKKADFAGGARASASGFAIGNKGYLGLGADASHVKQKDFWEFTPSLTIPTAITYTTNLAFGLTPIDKISPFQYTLIAGENLTSDITVTPPEGFEISKTEPGSGYVTTSLTIPHNAGTVSGKFIYVRFAPTTIQPYNGNIVITSTGATTKYLAVSGTGVANNTIEGTLIENRTLYKSNSPYLVTGDITIPNTKTLTIEPGVELNFQGHYAINVQGRLLAVGTNSDSIRFRANFPSNGWNSVRFFRTVETNDSSIFRYCSIMHGHADDTGYTWGGAICLDAVSNVSIMHCLFEDNMALSGGGAISCNENSNPLIKRNSFYNNRAYGEGGAIYIVASYPRIENNIISGNYVGSANYTYGGAISIRNGSDPYIINNKIYSNRSFGAYSTSGAGIMIGGNSAPKIFGNLLQNNFFDVSTNSQAAGGAISINASNPVIVNNTIIQNGAYKGAGIFMNNSSSPVFKNNIIRENTASSSTGNQILAEGGTPSYNNNNITNLQGCGSGNGNIDLSPLFFGDGVETYTLAPNSPCVNAGATLLLEPWMPLNDLGGHDRFIGTIDIGAYECQNPSSINSDLLPTVTKLEQNYPNPFNPQTTITYSLKEAAPVNISIYNHTGQLVKTLVSGTQKAGYYSAVWDASSISSGIYFYQMKAGDYQMIKRAVVIK